MLKNAPLRVRRFKLYYPPLSLSHAPLNAQRSRRQIQRSGQHTAKPDPEIPRTSCVAMWAERYTA